MEVVSHVESSGGYLLDPWPDMKLHTSQSRVRSGIKADGCLMGILRVTDGWMALRIGRSQSSGFVLWTKLGFNLAPRPKTIRIFEEPPIDLIPTNCYRTCTKPEGLRLCNCSNPVSLPSRVHVSVVGPTTEDK